MASAQKELLIIWAEALHWLINDGSGISDGTESQRMLEKLCDERSECVLTQIQSGWKEKVERQSGAGRVSGSNTSDPQNIFGRMSIFNLPVFLLVGVQKNCAMLGE